MFAIFAGMGRRLLPNYAYWFARWYRDTIGAPLSHPEERLIARIEYHRQHGRTRLIIHDPHYLYRQLLALYARWYTERINPFALAAIMKQHTDPRDHVERLIYHCDNIRVLSARRSRGFRGPTFQLAIILEADNYSRTLVDDDEYFSLQYTDLAGGLDLTATLIIHGNMHPRRGRKLPYHLAYLLASGLFVEITTPAEAIEVSIRSHPPVKAFIICHIGRASADQKPPPPPRHPISIRHYKVRKFLS